MAKKIKNPERYIGRLKKKIEQLKYDSKLQGDKILQLKGVAVVDWVDGIEDEHDCYSNSLGEFRLNDDVAVIGRIIEVTENYDKNGKAQSSIRFKRLYTKKVERY